MKNKKSEHNLQNDFYIDAYIKTNRLLIINHNIELVKELKSWMESGIQSRKCAE